MQPENPMPTWILSLAVSLHSIRVLMITLTSCCHTITGKQLLFHQSGTFPLFQGVKERPPKPAMILVRMEGFTDWTNGVSNLVAEVCGVPARCSLIIHAITGVLLNLANFPVIHGKVFQDDRWSSPPGSAKYPPTKVLHGSRRIGEIFWSKA